MKAVRSADVRTRQRGIFQYATSSRSRTIPR
jgi:hypothetical protein